MVEQYITQGLYQEALDCLVDMEDETVRYQRLLCLVALQRYMEAYNEGKVALAKATTTYYDVVALYIEVLKELEEYEEAVDILVQELQMPYIPSQYSDLFNEAYDYILLLKQEKNAGLKSRSKEVFDEQQIEEALFGDNQDMLLLVLEQLENYNIRKILYMIKEYLADGSKDGNIKSYLLDLLVDQQIDDDLYIVKNGYEVDINPLYLEKVFEHSSYETIASLLSEQLEDDNPSLYELCIGFLRFYLYYVYPIFIDEENYQLIAGSIHFYIAALNGMDPDVYDILTTYQIEEQQLINQLQEFNELKSE